MAEYELGLATSQLWDLGEFCVPSGSHFPHPQNGCNGNSTYFTGLCKESPCSAGDLGLIPGSGRSPGEGNGNPLQYSCLENAMDTGAWQTTVCGVTRVGHNLATKPPLQGL